MTLDDSLRVFHGTNPEFTDFGTDKLANHGPMAAHALHALGLHSSIEAFTERYRKRTRPLADDGGAAAHIAEYRESIAAKGWRVALAEALPSLAPGVSAAAFHGLLRVTHAARALAEEETEVRRVELAHGLSLWRARAETLPGDVGARPSVGLAEFLRAVPLVVERIDGLIIDRMLQVRTLPAFAETVATVDLNRSVDDATTALTSFAAERLLGAPSRRAVFAYLHMLTSTSCLRALARIDEDSARLLVGPAVHAVAALESVTNAPDEAAPKAPAAWTEDALRAHAADCPHPSHDHHIKLIEAALREHAAAPRDVLLAAATSAVA